MTWVNIKCICGKDLEVFRYDSKAKWGHNKKYCGRECQQKAYRQTERGKAITTEYNKRYKRQEKEYTCFVCAKVFKSTRKRTFCDEHSTQYYRTQKLRATRKDIVEGIRHNDRLHKKIKRGTVSKPACAECGKDSDIIHFHHVDYAKPDVVIPLCPGCHGKTKR